MTTASPRGASTRPAEGRPGPIVDPSLLARIVTPDAPRGVPKMTEPPAAMPGERSEVRRALGLVQFLRRGVAYTLDGLERFGDLHRTYMAFPMVVVWDADEIHRILLNEERAWSTAMGWEALMFDRIDPASANLGTLLSLDFDEHRRARKLVQPAFTLRAIEGYLRVAQRSFDREIPRWVARGRVDLKARLRHLFAAISSEIFTGIHDPKSVAVVDRALFDFWSGMMAVAKNPWISPKFRRSQRGFATLRRMFLERVAERRARGGDDVFSHLCRAEPDGVTDEALVRVFLTIMFGAFDTTSAAVTSMGYLLAKHPDWQERLRDEAMRVPAGALDAAALKKLQELEWAWKETLRLMPVNSFVPRRALRDVTIGGHTIRAGTFVAPMASGIGRHPRWWTNPNTFDPERFSPERAEDKRHPGIFVPFGGGAHACVGMQLATMETKLFWHRMLTSCRFRLAKDYDARHTNTPMGCVSGKVRLALEPL